MAQLFSSCPLSHEICTPPPATSSPPTSPLTHSDVVDCQPLAPLATAALLNWCWPEVSLMLSYRLLCIKQQVHLNHHPPKSCTTAPSLQRCVNFPPALCELLCGWGAAPLGLGCRGAAPQTDILRHPNRREVHRMLEAMTPTSRASHSSVMFSHLHVAGILSSNHALAPHRSLPLLNTSHLPTNKRTCPYL